MRRSPEEKKLPAFDLLAAREAKGLTQAETAELLESSQSSIARWESEGSLPRIYRKFWQLYWQTHKPVSAVKKKKQ